MQNLAVLEPPTPADLDAFRRSPLCDLSLTSVTFGYPHGIVPRSLGTPPTCPAHLLAISHLYTLPLLAFPLFRLAAFAARAGRLLHNSLIAAPVFHFLWTPKGG